MLSAIEVPPVDPTRPCFLMSEVPVYSNLACRAQGLEGWLPLFRRPAGENCPFGPQRALPTETNDESGTSQSKSGTSVDLSNSGNLHFEPCMDASRLWSDLIS